MDIINNKKLNKHIDTNKKLFFSHIPHALRDFVPVSARHFQLCGSNFPTDIFINRFKLDIFKKKATF